MRYPDGDTLRGLANTLAEYAQLKSEIAGEENVIYIVDQTARILRQQIETVCAVPDDLARKADEPNDLEGIRALSVGWGTTADIPACPDYENRLKGALFGRFAGCTLGVPVENWSMREMSDYARYLGMPFPPTTYWKQVQRPFEKRYAVSMGDRYTETGMDGVPVDDDVTYTLIGLLILEECGPNFTTEDVARTWKKYLPVACTAESVALENYKKGIVSEKAAECDNPYCEFIGSVIRADPWGYVFPGNPRAAAEAAWRDAYFTHRRNGIFGAMYFAAGISLAFVSRSVREALEGSLAYIPQNCRLAQALRWAISAAGNMHTFEEARLAVDAKFPGMHPVHTINNACITVLGLLLGHEDYTKTISDIVAMGMDNDCNAATAGSILGAFLGYDRLPPHWFSRFHDRVYSYMNGLPVFSLEDLLERYVHQREICGRL